MKMPTVAILGGGQLGRMLALAAAPLGVQCRLYDPTADACAGQVAPLTVGTYDDEALLRTFAADADVITYEFENVPVATARLLQQIAPVYPPPAALEVAQDRLHEKQLFTRLGIPTPPYHPVDSEHDLHAAVAAIGLPAVLKTRRLGYDGKGQAVLRSDADVTAAWQQLGGVPLILEGFVPFERELSIIAVRAPDGTVATYPLPENNHAGGILRRSVAPAANLTADLTATANDYARRVLDTLDYIGVLAIELFQVAAPAATPSDDGHLLANEMAPRVHNSGHWTQDGAITSQFENHLRAILGLPLGATAARGVAAMHNLIGEVPPTAAVLALPTAHLHLYGKQPRPGRKVGHINLTAADHASLHAQLDQLMHHLPPAT